MIINKHLENFQNNIQFNFNNKDNLLKALIHPSFIKDKKILEIEIYKNNNFILALALILGLNLRFSIEGSKWSMILISI